jgi:dTDP-4-dehydrorhamnose reductase
MRTLLVTGANGFVGSYLVRKLSGSYRLIATGVGRCRIALPANAVWESLDITDRDAVNAVLRRYRPHVVVHGAALSKPDQCEQDRALADRVNVRATQYLLDASESCGAHFIFLSTDFVFDGSKGMYREEDAVGPVNYYGATKVQAEALVQQYPQLWSIARTVLVYGDPRGARGNLLTMVAGALKEGRSLRIFNDQLRTPTYVEDLVDGLACIAGKEAAGTYHLSGEEVRTPYQMAAEAARHLGLDETLIEPITEADMQEPAKRPQKTGFDISKARKELGYSSLSFEEGLMMTFGVPGTQIY